MNQRVLSSSSMMLKGVTLKSSDWSDSSVDLASNRMIPRVNSITSNWSAPLPSYKKLSNSNFNHDLQRFSSSYLTANTLNSSAAMDNATWDDVVAKPESTLNKLTALINDHKTARSSNPFLDDTYDKTSSRPPDHNSNSLTSSKEESSTRAKLSVDEPSTTLDLNKSTSKRALEEERKTQDFEETFVVSTFQNKTPKKLDTRVLSSDALEMLHGQDVFMYYSIPEVRHAAMKGMDVDYNQVKEHGQVKRCSAISFESADIDLVTFEDLDVPSLGGEYFDRVGGEDEDLFWSYFD